MRKIIKLILVVVLTVLAIIYVSNIQAQRSYSSITSKKEVVSDINKGLKDKSIVNCRTTDYGYVTLENDSLNILYIIGKEKFSATYDNLIKIIISPCRNAPKYFTLIDNIFLYLTDTKNLINPENMLKVNDNFYYFKNTGIEVKHIISLFTNIIEIDYHNLYLY